MANEFKQLRFEYPTKTEATRIYKIIDLFAGIGGIRTGFQQAFKEYAQFIFASEIDKFSAQTYQANYGELPVGDITQIKAFPKILKSQSAIPKLIGNLAIACVPVIRALAEAVFNALSQKVT